MSVNVAIEPIVFAWACSKISLSDEELIQKFPKFKQWESGEAEPTLKQAEDFAALARIPFGRLLLAQPSGEDIGIADFRTVRNSHVDSLSPDLREVIVGAQKRLGWYADFTIDVGMEAPELVGIVAPQMNPSDAALAVREFLDLGVQNPIPGSEKVSSLVALIEDAGVLVSRNSIVGSSTRRPLNVEEFLGFTLIDNGFGLIFVNTRDSKTAQLFSLAHELGHIVRAQSGISDHSEQKANEHWCNQFASAFLAFETEYPDSPFSSETVESQVGRRFLCAILSATRAGKISEQNAARYLGITSYGAFQKLISS